MAKDRKKLLLTGATGTLGAELRKQFPEALVPAHQQLDITDHQAVLKFMKNENVGAVIHTAAVTSVRECENNKQLAWKTNVEGTRNLVESLKSTNGKNSYFVHVSTACVFHGDESMYTEISIPYPVNFYSTTKLVGENIVKSLNNSLILRTNFVGGGKWPYQKAFTDRFGTYLFAENVANAIRELFDKSMIGTIHVVGDRVLSMYELAKMTTKNIEPMTIKDYSGPHLTMNMTLDTVRWKKYKIS